jgi:hypothetical protein
VIPDYKNMAVGARVPMPELVNAWQGANQDLYNEIQAYCRTCTPQPQFEVETKRISKDRSEFYLKRTR